LVRDLRVGRRQVLEERGQLVLVRDLARPLFNELEQARPVSGQPRGLDLGLVLVVGRDGRGGPEGHRGEGKKGKEAVANDGSGRRGRGLWVGSNYRRSPPPDRNRRSRSRQLVGRRPAGRGSFISFIYTHSLKLISPGRHGDVAGRLGRGKALPRRSRFLTYS